nr:methyltransferase domain-containing protein [Ornithinimicrobium sp. HY1745]
MSSHYDPEWVLSLDMGPHPLWQLEEMWADLSLSPGQRVLDLGPGHGATSVFLAREASVTVDALDAWISPDESKKTLTAAGVGDVVRPVQGDVRTWDLEPEAYDAIVSIDAWEYFGTDVHFLPRLTRALKPGGTLAFSTPSLTDDPYAVAPLPLLRDLVGAEVMAWHSPQWWATHTEVTGGLEDVRAWIPQDSLDLWWTWEQALDGEDSRLREALEAYRRVSTDAPALGIVHVMAHKPAR